MIGFGGLNEHEFLDMANNPFIDWSSREHQYQPTSWHHDDVANARVRNKCRKNLKRINFFLDHPIVGGWDEETLNGLNQQLVIWTRRLNKAHYN